MTTLDRPTSPHADPAVGEDMLVTLDLELAYECQNARHMARRHVAAVNMWRDVLPDGLSQKLMGLRAGDGVTLGYGPGALAEPRREALVRTIPLRHFDASPAPRVVCHLDIGRFLPQGTLYRAGIAGVYRDSLRPFRVLDVTGDTLTADLNPHFAGFAATLTTAVTAVRRKAADVGGRCQDLTALITDGAGMQVRAGTRPTAFMVRDWNARIAEGDDAEFYAGARHVAHLDARARAHVRDLYRSLVAPGARVLDLMSSIVSHLPEDLQLAHVTGLGMNEEELAANSQLGTRLLHDLNRNPTLPVDDAAFDAAICTVSVEYLTDPVTLFREVARVLRPGGVFAVTFSNRWFPPKVIKVWRDAHPAERMGLVLEWYLLSEGFSELSTLSIEGYARPEDDPHIKETSVSDPVHAVWGRRRGAT